LVLVFGFLLFVAFFFSNAETWREIGSGFLKFGNVPIQRAEDVNGNGQLDPGEDWDKDGRLDVVEPRVDLNGNGKREPGEFIDRDGDKCRDGANVDNVFLALWQGRPLPTIDLTMLGILGAMVAISGTGGLTNTTVSSYTRDQGWGMGQHVGAIPSVIGGHKLELAHVGMVFLPTAEATRRWNGWKRWVLRDQLVVWMPACFLGLALPSMLSVQFLPRGTEANDWVAAGMTAGYVRDAVGASWGTSLGATFWYLTLLCGFLVLGTSMVTTADGTLRRWVDVFWTGSPRLRQWEPRRIRSLYFGALCGYAVLGVIMLWCVDSSQILVFATTLYNVALGFSCFHVLAVNSILLPRELRPGLFSRTVLVLAGLFFSTLASARNCCLPFLERLTQSGIRNHSCVPCSSVRPRPESRVTLAAFEAVLAAGDEGAAEVDVIPGMLDDRETALEAPVCLVSRKMPH
jgi:hypothetical protein